MTNIHWYVLGGYTAYLLYIRWRMSRLEVWFDGHEMDHADDERLATTLKNARVHPCPTAPKGQYGILNPGSTCPFCGLRP